MNTEEIRAAVFASLGTAKAEGLFDADRALHGMTAAHLAEELAGYEAEFKMVSPHDIEPHAAAWLAGATDSPIKEVRYIDITPTWSAVLPVLLFGLDAGTPEGRKIAREELARMAQLADAYNASKPKDMTPEQIGEALKRESELLAQDGHYGASEALISFARQATPAELTRFRELIRAAE